MKFKIKSKLEQIERIKDLLFSYAQLKTENLPGVAGQVAAWAWARRQGLRLLVVTSLSAGVTWFGAHLLMLDSPIIAVLAATVTVQSAVHASLKDGAARIGATIAALAVAVGLFHLIGIHAWSISIVVAVSLLAGRLLGLGAQGAIQVPATSLGVFVVASGLTQELITDRIIATLMGVGIGVGFSFFAHRAGPAERAREAIEKLNLQVAELLGEMAENIEGKDAQVWLERSRELLGQVDRIRTLVQSASSSARWGTRRSREEAKEISISAKALEHSLEQANSLARTFYDLEQRSDSYPLVKEVGCVLEKTSLAFEIKAGEMPPEKEDKKELEDALEEIKEEKRELLEKARQLDDTATWLVSGAIMNSVDRMVESLDESAAALQVGEEEKTWKEALEILKKKG